MDYTPSPLPPDNTSLSFLSLCPTAATLFFLPSAYSLLFITALPGNALSLWVFLRCISKTSYHVYLSHLSISNLLLSLTSPFLAAYYARGSVWTMSSVLCQLVLHGVTPVVHINIYISVMILTWVALCRFAAIIQHTHASRPSFCKSLLPDTFFTHLTRPSFARMVCGVLWSVMACIVPVTVYYSVREVSEDGQTGRGGGVEVCYNPAVEIGGRLSAAMSVPFSIIFFIFYLMVQLFYMTVLSHIRRSRHSTNISTSQSLLDKVLRNIMVIQVVFSFCLLPYQIFKPIFIYRAHYQRWTQAPGPDVHTHCHPLSTFIELKNCLVFLALLRSSTDPVMYFVLDKTFQHETLELFRRLRSSRRDATPGQRGGGNTATVDVSKASAL